MRQRGHFHSQGSAGTFTLKAARALSFFQGSKFQAARVSRSAGTVARFTRPHTTVQQSQPPPRPETRAPTDGGTEGGTEGGTWACRRRAGLPDCTLRSNLRSSRAVRVLVLWVCDLRCLAPPVSTAASAAVTIWRVRAVTHWWLCPRDLVDRALGAMPSGALGAMLPGALGAVLSVFVALDAVLPVLLARCFRCSAPCFRCPWRGLPVLVALGAVPSGALGAMLFGACRSWRGAFRCSWRSSWRDALPVLAVASAIAGGASKKLGAVRGAWCVAWRVQAFWVLWA